MMSLPESSMRQEIKALFADGLKTNVRPFPKTEKEFRDILDALRAVPPDELERKLIIAGSSNQPSGDEQSRCYECMYYLVHREWCDLPELSIPVEAEWSCSLWRI